MRPAHESMKVHETNYTHTNLRGKQNKKEGYKHLFNAQRYTQEIFKNISPIYFHGNPSFYKRGNRPQEFRLPPQRLTDSE